MKKHLLTLLLPILAAGAFAQPYATVQDGLFTDPATWGGVSPVTGGPGSMTISHTVTLDTNWYQDQNMTITSSGSLIDDSSPSSFSVSGGASTFLNDGNINISEVVCGIFGWVNNGAIEVDTVGYMVGLTNDGSFTVHSSCYWDYAITNNAAGTLVIDGMLIGGGYNYGTFTVDSLVTRGIDNHGTINVATDFQNYGYVWNYPSGSINAGGKVINAEYPWWVGWGSIALINEGNLHAGSAIENHYSLLNSGTINTDGPFTNTDSILNTAGGSIRSVGAFTNVSDTAFIINEGYFNMKNNFTNKNVVLNTSIFNVDNDFENNGSFTNAGSGTFIVKNDFLTKDLGPPGGTFVENGWGYIYGDFTNQSTITGSGRFCVWGVSTNNGSMTGTFDFCDNTGDSLDVNTGTFAPTLTVCTFPCSIGLLDETEEQPLVIAPNPAHETATVQLGSSGMPRLLNTASLRVTDVGGREVTALLHPTLDASSIRLDCSALSHGIYFVTFTQDNKVFRGKLVVQ